MIALKSCLCINFLLLLVLCLCHVFNCLNMILNLVCLCVTVCTTFCFEFSFWIKHIYFALLVIQAIFKHVIPSSIEIMYKRFLSIKPLKSCKTASLQNKTMSFKFCPFFLSFWRCESVIKLNSIYCAILLIHSCHLKYSTAFLKLYFCKTFLALVQILIICTNYTKKI